MSTNRRIPSLLPFVALALLTFVAGCGGGGGGEGGGSAFVLLAFDQAGQDNVPLNRSLEFRFSGEVDPGTVSPSSIQVREGSAFGATVPGTFQVNGAIVTFLPKLAGLCDLSDSGLQAGVTYRVSVVGYPEAFGLSNVDGVALDRTSTYEFTTRSEGDPDLFEDQIPGVGPSVVSTTPANSAPCVPVALDNEAIIVFSENLNPCTVGGQTIQVYEYERGDPATFQPAPNGSNSGFVTPTPSGVADATPANPYTWGATNAITLVDPPQRVRAEITLVQSLEGTQVHVHPEGGRWPEDALIVIDLSFNITDFGGLPLSAHVFAFTTENVPAQPGQRDVLWEGETPVDDGNTTADVNTARSPSKAQGYMLFAGDGDNGFNLLQPCKPATPASACLVDRQANDAVKDDFDPSTDVTLDTGLTVNTCVNATDASRAVVWEFNTFRIRTNRTVRVIGVNPAIILVQGDVTIETGGRLLVRGDGAGGSPNPHGGNGNIYPNYTLAAVGGKAVAGGGRGGNGIPPYGTGTSWNYGEDGTAGFGSPGAGTVGGMGAGQGGVSALMSGTAQNGGSSAGGGGGGHGAVGTAGAANVNAVTPFVATSKSAGGATYPTGASADLMLTPSAGSGGGASGSSYTTTYTSFAAGGGAGGAGGGFVDLTSSGDIFVFGTIDATGGRGGSGGSAFITSGGGGGGGSGGGVRLLTPNEINLNGGTITTAGGAGGSGGLATYNYVNGPRNPGGAGGSGRLVLEDADSVVSGIPASMVPGEGQPGFYRSVFDPSRFKGGGLTPSVHTFLFYTGVRAPAFLTPVPADFPTLATGPAPGPGVGIPPIASRGPGATGILIEMRGYAMLADGEPDEGSPTAYYTVGYFTDSGQEDAPNWVPGAFPADIGPRPADNAGDGISNLDGNAFVELRVTYFLPNTIGPFDAGPYINTWYIRYSFDQ